MLDFTPDFAGPGDWAGMYRAVGLQVVPALTHEEDPIQWKRPALPQWKQLEHELVPNLTFERWYGPAGTYARRQNMGMITGSCSGNAFVLDLDTQKHESAAHWWLGLLASENNSDDLHTLRQTTGGGGVQMIFRAPAGVEMPTFKTSIGVDVRGEGGFAMLPPSRHESGREYAWNVGREPWNDCDIEDAPQWLLDAIFNLAAEHGWRGNSKGGNVRTASPEAVVNAFNQHTDNREDYMTRLVWGAVVDWWRECPIRPSQEESEARMREAFELYLMKVATRIDQPGTPKHVLLEREGRGISMFADKWQRAMAKWDGEVADEGKKPKPVKEQEAAEIPALTDFEFDPITGEILDYVAPKEEAPPSDKPKPRIELIAWDDLPEVQVRWLIKDFLPHGGFAALYGKPGSYKSFVALYIAATVAHGAPAFDRETTAGDVIYIAGEGGAGLKKRKDAFVRHYGVPAGTRVHFIRAQLNLRSTLEDATAVVEQIAAQKLRPVLVIIDTLARAFAGGNENASEDMGAFISVTGKLQEALGGPTVLVVHHSGKDEARGMRGHSALLGAVDTELEVLKLSDDDSPDRIGQMTVTKQKDGEDGFKIGYRMESVPLGLGAEASLVVVPDSDLEAPTRKRPLPSGTRKAMDALERALEDDPQTVVNRNIPGGVVCARMKLWREIFYALEGENGDSAQKAFKRAKNDLQARNLIGVWTDNVWKTQ